MFLDTKMYNILNSLYLDTLSKFTRASYMEDHNVADDERSTSIWTEMCIYIHIYNNLCVLLQWNLSNVTTERTPLSFGRLYDEGIRDEWSNGGHNKQGFIEQVWM